MQLFFVCQSCLVLLVFYYMFFRLFGFSYFLCISSLHMLLLRALISHYESYLVYLLKLDNICLISLGLAIWLVLLKVFLFVFFPNNSFLHSFVILLQSSTKFLVKLLVAIFVNPFYIGIIQYCFIHIFPPISLVQFFYKNPNFFNTFIIKALFIKLAVILVIIEL